jgi:alkylation response protein AidB-like acyl-CoA dehydrogenase
MHTFTEDQALFKDVVVRFFADKSPSSEVRKLMASESGYDAGVWTQMSEELGVPGLHIPEQFGGFGFGIVELGIVLEEMGRKLYCGPFFGSSVMAGYALMLTADEDAKQGLLPELASGACIFSLALDSLDSVAEWGSRLRFVDGVIHGLAPIVLDAGIASRLLVIASCVGDELGLFEVATNSGGLDLSAREVIDPTRKIYSVSFDGVEAKQLGTFDRDQAQNVMDQWALCLAHEMIGGAQYLLDSTVDYMGLRYQFGRAIGSFQGLKHRCAELLMELELAKGVVGEATVAAQTGEGDRFLPNMAKAMASDAYMSVAKAAVQLRGGIGFTWENDTHLWFKRAKSSEVFLGTPALHRERIIQVIEGATDAT